MSDLLSRARLLILGLLLGAIGASGLAIVAEQIHRPRLKGAPGVPVVQPLVDAPGEPNPSEIQIAVQAPADAEVEVTVHVRPRHSVRPLSDPIAYIPRR